MRVLPQIVFPVVRASAAFLNWVCFDGLSRVALAWWLGNSCQRLLGPPIGGNGLVHSQHPLRV